MVPKSCHSETGYRRLHRLRVQGSFLGQSFTPGRKGIVFIDCFVDVSIENHVNPTPPMGEGDQDLVAPFGPEQ